jgi:hypothetical protein
MNARRRRVGGEKVRTASLLQGSGLVRTVGPCAQKKSSLWPAMLNERRKAPSSSGGAQATEPRAKREARSVLCYA